MRLVRSSALPYRTSGMWEDPEHRFMLIRAQERHWTILPIIDGIGANELATHKKLISTYGLEGPFSTRRAATQALEAVLGGVSGQ